MIAAALVAAVIMLIIGVIVFVKQQQEKKVSFVTDLSSSPPSSLPLSREERERGEGSVKPKKKTFLSTVPAIADSAAKPVTDTVTVKKDTLIVPDSSMQSAAADTCLNDTLWVYPEPSGGHHYGPVTLAFRSNRTCRILWRFNPDTAWQEYDGQAIQVKKSIAIEFRSFDKCNNPTEIREEYYEIDLTKRTNVCPDDMELVAIGGTRFCADRYEWPNRKGVVPVSYVSFYQAGDSCFTVGKRLCSSEEWSLACSGPYGWKYPYGQQYESNACVVSDTMPHASGEHSECRSWFGTFDMAGNLAEWTSTPAKENRSFYDVAGGFWESGASSGCFDVKYSYFPQNRHNPVGFRCCKDAGAGK